MTGTDLVQLNDPFQVASLSKAMTAVLINQLVEQKNCVGIQVLLSYSPNGAIKSALNIYASP